MEKIKFNRPLISIQDICNFIKKGENYMTGDYESNIDILQAIVLNPPYQRNYRSSIKEESLIIESIIKGIPIPEVFLIQISKNEAQVRNVMDGKHRLNAIYRYFLNKYKLVDVENFDGNEINGYFFKDLDPILQIKILTSHIAVLEFESLEDPKLEVSLFKRYNKNTKPLQSSEINFASYSSKTSDFISQFVLKELGSDSVCSKIYNSTKDRKNKQTVHQNIFTILYLLEYGFEKPFKDSVDCAEQYMKEKSLAEDENLNETKKSFEIFNNFAKVISEKIEYPFSNELYSDDGKRSYKFQIGVVMYLATLLHYFEVDIESKELYYEIKYIMLSSHIADPNFQGSSTSYKEIKKNISEVLNNDYESLTKKNNG